MPADDDAALRPSALDGFVGQAHFVPNLRVFLASARSRNKSLDHVLLGGPPGLGKTTLAQIIANELEVKLHLALAPTLQKVPDVVRLLAKVAERDVLFIDEIHRLTPTISEIFYPIMEDFRAELTFGDARNKQTVQAHMAPFTLIGATTRAGMLAQPLRDRFPIQFKLALYSVEELTEVVKGGAAKIGITIDAAGAQQVARRARGTPRIALQLLRRCHDFVVVHGSNGVDSAGADASLLKLGIDGDGLNEEDHRYLRCLAEQFGGGPAGADTIAASMGDDRDNIEDVIEPYLMQAGLIVRTARGRMLTPTSLARYLPGLHITPT